MAKKKNSDEEQPEEKPTRKPASPKKSTAAKKPAAAKRPAAAKKSAAGSKPAAQKAPPKAEPEPEAEPAGAGSSGPQRLLRSSTDRYLAGVCGGVAEYLQVDAAIVRLIWAVFTFLGGVGLIAYIAAWVLLPENPDASRLPVPRSQQERSRNMGMVVGAVLVVFGLFLLGDQLHYHFRFPIRLDFLDFDYLGSLLIIGLGAYLILGRKKSDPEGEAADATSGAEAGGSPKLTRSVVDRKIGGVCGGLAKHFNIDPSLVRIGAVVIALVTNLVGVIIYVAMMIILPEDGTEGIRTEDHATT